MQKIFLKRIFLSLLTGLFSYLSLSGCVLRSLTIDSDPPGATVFLDNEPIGETPVTTSFIYYGTRKIMLEKTDGEGRLLYERFIVYEKIRRPFYQMFPLDFFSEVLLPVTLKDEHYLYYELEPVKHISVEERQREVMKNALELRERIQGIAETTK
ncbi:MAG: PEGA domain-containing protein [Candidatus Loosdrechtia sp.]|uniref:PEGA domain-containing protein n=1 Tax=Candidatus Loosdrechtia sp. TaxID=3101272 RepID=UPI003A66DB39|nr:MAG: PEGA domain-containing protein [Candidatus Jettenia sp. AMX2]